MRPRSAPWRGTRSTASSAIAAAIGGSSRDGIRAASSSSGPSKRRRPLATAWPERGGAPQDDHGVTGRRGRDQPLSTTGVEPSGQGPASLAAGTVGGRTRAAACAGRRPYRLWIAGAPVTVRGGGCRGDPGPPNPALAPDPRAPAGGALSATAAARSRSAPAPTGPGSRSVWRCRPGSHPRCRSSRTRCRGHARPRRRPRTRTAPSAPP